jgi:hypothetical protein
LENPIGGTFRVEEDDVRRNIGIQVGRTSSAKVGVHASKRRARVTGGSRGVVVVIFLDDEDECEEGEKERKRET